MSSVVRKMRVDIGINSRSLHITFDTSYLISKEARHADKTYSWSVNGAGFEPSPSASRACAPRYCTLSSSLGFLCCFFLLIIRSFMQSPALRFSSLSISGKLLVEAACLTTSKMLESWAGLWAQAQTILHQGSSHCEWTAQCACGISSGPQAQPSLQLSLVHPHFYTP